MNRKRAIKVSIIILSAILILGLGLISCFYLFVPGYVERTILPAILKDSGIELTHIKIRDIGTLCTEIGDVKIGPDNGGLLINSIRLDYTPSGLFNRHIKRVALSGISVDAKYKNNKLSIAGLDEILNKRENSKEDKKTTSPVTIGEIIIANSDLNLWYEGKNFRVPFEISATSFDKGFLPHRLMVKIYPDLQGLYVKDKNGKGWVTINISAKDSNRFDCEVSPLMIEYAGLPVEILLSGHAALDNSVLKSEIRVITRLVAENSPPPLEWGIKIDKAPDTVRVKIEGATDINQIGIPLMYSFNDTELTAFSPKISAFILYDKGALSGEYAFDFENIGVKKDKMSFSLPYVSIKGMIRQDEKIKNSYISSFTLNSREIIFQDNDIKAMIPEYLIKGEISHNTDEGINLDTVINFKKGVVSMENGVVNIKGIAGDFPFSWPLNSNSDRGMLSIGNFTYGNYTLGPVDLKIVQKKGDIKFTGTVKYPVLKDMIVNIKGSASPFADKSRTEMTMDIPDYKPASDIDLGKLIPVLKGYYFNGQLKTSGGIKFTDSSIKSGLDIRLEKGTLTNSEKKLSIQDIMLNLRLDDIISPKSPIGQKIKIGKVSMGDITATDFDADFRVESLSSMFIKQGMFKWCGGNISAQSFRLDMEKNEYKVTLLCDNLRLADILEQFGINGASGDGTVNGRIPLTISKGKIKFEDGFLSSTPGTGGKINIKGTDVFKTGMTPGTPEYVQMDIASEALKAFNYSWVKLSLDSNEGELSVKLQFDGKPENKLPFRYDKNLNSFMRVETTSEGSNFQGISLDVNLKLPLDELLNYKGALDMLK